MTALSDEVRLASAIADRIAAAGIGEDDPDFAELLASETDIGDRLRRIVRKARFVSADAKTLADMIADMGARKKRLEGQADSLRNTALWIMGEIGLRKIEAPDFTASLSAGRPKIEITDEAALPEDVCVMKREPSKAAIAAWLDEKSHCPGAERSNGAPTLTIRTR